MKLWLSFCLLVVMAFAACNSIPDHARYIPKDAAAVVGIHTGTIGKKIAWSKITGSPLLDELEKKMKENGGPGTLRDMQEAGIDGKSTVYIYYKSPALLDNRVTGLLPLEDAAKWEAYLKKKMPEAIISSRNGHKEAQLSPMAYVGWNDKLAIITSVVQTKTEVVFDTTITADGDTAMVANSSFAPIDKAVLQTALDSAFVRQGDNAVTEDSRFTKLEKDGHDLTFWMNYDAALRNVPAMGMMNMNTFWQNSALAYGIDFNKGEVVAKMRYYVADVLKEAAKELGKEKVDKEIIDHLPSQNLNALLAYHLSPKGLKLMLEKMNVLGVANLALSQQGISTDDIFNAFQGDMVVSINNLTISNSAFTTDSAIISTSATPSFRYTIAMKVGKKESLQKLLSFLVSRELIKKSTNDNIYFFPNGATMVVESGYIAVGNVTQIAMSFIDNKNRSGMPKPVHDKIYSQPFGLYIDAASILNAVTSMAASNPQGTAALNEAKQLFSHVTAHGGSFMDNYFQYEAELVFKNKDENSLVQLLSSAARANQNAAQ